MVSLPKATECNASFAVDELCAAVDGWHHCRHHRKKGHAYAASLKCGLCILESWVIRTYTGYIKTSTRPEKIILHRRSPPCVTHVCRKYVYIFRQMLLSSRAKHKRTPVNLSHRLTEKAKTIVRIPIVSPCFYPMLSTRSLSLCTRRLNVGDGSPLLAFW